MPTLEELKFDNANNTCLSLRVIAEWVRTGDVVLAGKADAPYEDAEVLTIPSDLILAFSQKASRP